MPAGGLGLREFFQFNHRQASDDASGGVCDEAIFRDSDRSRSRSAVTQNEAGAPVASSSPLGMSMARTQAPCSRLSRFID